MRILAATSGDDVQGAITDAEERVGSITVGGTIGFVIFVGVFGGVVGGIVFVALRRWLPGRAWTGGLATGLLLLFFARVDPLDPESVDLEILSPDLLAVVLFLTLFPLFGMTMASLVSRFERSYPTLSRRPRGSRRTCRSRRLRSSRRSRWRSSWARAWTCSPRPRRSHASGANGAWTSRDEGYSSSRARRVSSGSAPASVTSSAPEWLPWCAIDAGGRAWACTRFHPTPTVGSSTPRPSRPSTGCYDDGREQLLRLYDKGKRKQWIGSDRIDWSHELDPENPLGMPDEVIAIYGTPWWDKMNAAGAGRGAPAPPGWQFSQFMHGEQGALICAAKIVQTVPDLDSKYYAATQVIDEARHVEVYSRYLHEKLETGVPDQPAPEGAARRRAHRLALGHDVPRRCRCSSRASRSRRSA